MQKAQLPANQMLLRNDFCTWKTVNPEAAHVYGNTTDHKTDPNVFDYAIMVFLPKYIL